MDPRNVRFDDGDSRNELENLTIMYVKDGRQYSMRVAGMFDEAIEKPIEAYEVMTHHACEGIYDDCGVEVWPSNCRALRYDCPVAELSTAKLGLAIKKGKV